MACSSSKCGSALVLVILAIFPLPALAYIEPGSGNLTLQLLFGGAAGTGLFVKVYGKAFWQAIKKENTAQNQLESDKNDDSLP